MLKINSFLACILLVLAMLGAPPSLRAQAPAPSSTPISASAELNTNKLKTDDKLLLNLNSTQLALQGYDPVAYIKSRKPQLGLAQYTAVFQGACYQFASPGNQAEFQRDPAKYAPQFGGYCGYAVSQNQIAPIDPNFFVIADDLLILLRDQNALDQFNRDLQGSLSRARGNWLGLVAKQGKKQTILLNADKAGLALKGYDPVAYFKSNAATKGSPGISAAYHGATYHFASEENKKEFEANPDRYEPAYGGYCGYAASVNKLAPIDPEIFQIAQGRLILQYSKSTYDKFNKDLPNSITAADRHWPELVQKNYGKPQGGFLSSLGF